MRKAFLESLLSLAERDERVWLVTGDLGFGVLEPFAARFPGRFVNAGVAEQNMTGVAAGLALAGLRPFTYSIANFPVIRCLEQIRNDVVYHHLPVCIVAVGGGLGYGSAGYSHHGVEDLAVTRTLPGLTVVAPGDPLEARLAVTAIGEHDGPCYLRLGKGGEPAVHASPPAFSLGAAIPLASGRDVTLVATGGGLAVAQEALGRLAQAHVSAALLSMPTVEPIDEAALLQAVRSTGRIVTVEDHRTSGLGAATAEALARLDVSPRLAMVGLSGPPSLVAGSQEALRLAGGLSVAAVVAAAERLLRPASSGQLPEAPGPGLTPSRRGSPP